MTTKETIARWFDEGVARGATHMAVVCDTSDHSDFTVYVRPGQDAREVAKQHDNAEKMLRLMAVYDLRQDRDLQLNMEGWVFNYGDEGSKPTCAEPDLLPTLRTLTECSAAEDPRALDNVSYCPPTMDVTVGSGLSAKYVRADLALEAAGRDARKIVKEPPIPGGGETETAVVKCAICRDQTKYGLRFCSECTRQAQDSLDRHPSPDDEAAVRIASDYLRWLYVGVSGEDDTGNTELVMLAVAASNDLRAARDKISRLEAEVRQPRSRDPQPRDLASLVKP